MSRVDGSWVRETTATATVGARTLRGLLRAGAVAPVGPRGLLRTATAPLRFGAGPATLFAAAARRPEQPAIVDDRVQRSYGELHERAAAISRHLADGFGLGPGRGLAILCRNHAGFVEAVVAGSRTGADLLLLNTDFPGPQLAQVLARERPAVVVHDEEFTEALHTAGYDGPTVLAWHGTRSPVPTLDQLAAGGGRGASSWKQGRIVLLSSGTTGTPKGVPRNPKLGGLLGPTATLLERLPLQARAPMLIGPPFFHGFGLAFLFLAASLQATVVTRRRFSAPAALRAIEAHRVATVVGVPAMLQRLVEDDPELLAATDVSAVEALLSAAAPLTPALADTLTRAFGEVVHNLYGSTETGFGALADPQDLRAAPGTVGRPPHGTTVRILDDRGHPVAAGTVGRIHLGGGLAAEAGLLDTGDLGHLDAEGRLFVDGRADDMIVSGGENVFPAEVEIVLAAHDAVADVAVVGVPDDRFGQRLVAFVVLRGGASLDATDLTAHVRRQVARYKVPREVVLVDAVPRNPTGKVLRQELVSRATRS